MDTLKGVDFNEGKNEMLPHVVEHLLKFTNVSHSRLELRYINIFTYAPYLISYLLISL